MVSRALPTLDSAVCELLERKLIFSDSADRAVMAAGLSLPAPMSLDMVSMVVAVLSSVSPQAWAMASSWRTPGITGLPGKWPWKKGSLNVTFLIATARVSSRFAESTGAYDRSLVLANTALGVANSTDYAPVKAEALARAAFAWIDNPDAGAKLVDRFDALHRQLRCNTAQAATDAIEKVLAA